ncbi:hypothetical protein D3C75_684860 [compost metagenome]
MKVLVCFVRKSIHISIVIWPCPCCSCLAYAEISSGVLPSVSDSMIRRCLLTSVLFRRSVEMTSWVRDVFLIVFSCDGSGTEACLRVTFESGRRVYVNTAIVKAAVTKPAIIAFLRDIFSAPSWHCIAVGLGERAGFMHYRKGYRRPRFYVNIRK